jgi:hypothetical protein
MLTLKRLEDILAAARSKGAPDTMEILFCAGNSGVAANAFAGLNEAANLSAGEYLENPTEEVVTGAPRLVINQA